MRKILAGLGALLALFHVWLFAGQIWSGRLSEPGLLVRWLGGLIKTARSDSKTAPIVAKTVETV